MTLSKTFKDIALLLIGILSLLFLFILQGILEQVDYSVELEAPFTGDVIKIGDGSSGGNQTPFVPKPRPPSKRVPPITNKNLQCWLQAGVSKEDLIIIGPLLQTTPCTIPREHKAVHASIAEQCLVLSIEKRAQTGLCVDGQTPSLTLDFPAQGEGRVVVPEVKRDYVPLILFLLLLFLVFSIWSWEEMRDTFRKKYKHKVYDEIELIYSGEVPSYEEAIAEEDTETEKINKIYEQLVKEKKRRALQHTLTKREIASAVHTFNTLSDKLYHAIKRNDIVHAEKYYKTLFNVYLHVYHSVTEENKKTILQIIIYFGKQLALLQKGKKIARLIKEAYIDADKYKVREERPAKEDIEREPDVVVPEDLRKGIDELKLLLQTSKQGKGSKRLKKLFTT